MVSTSADWVKHSSNRCCSWYGVATS
ncbi:hypothetical protein [Pseudomonas sp. I2]